MNEKIGVHLHHFAHKAEKLIGVQIAQPGFRLVGGHADRAHQLITMRAQRTSQVAAEQLRRGRADGGVCR